MIDSAVGRIVLRVLLVVDPRGELALLHRLVRLGVRVLAFPGKNRRLVGLVPTSAASVGLVFVLVVFYVSHVRFAAGDTGSFESEKKKKVFNKNNFITCTPLA